MQLLKTIRKNAAVAIYISRGDFWMISRLEGYRGKSYVNYKHCLNPILAETFRLRKLYLKMIKNPLKTPSDLPTVLYNPIDEVETKEVKEAWGFARDSKDFVELKFLVEMFPEVREFRDIMEHKEKFRS